MLSHNQSIYLFDVHLWNICMWVIYMENDLTSQYEEISDSTVHFLNLCLWAAHMKRNWRLWNIWDSTHHLWNIFMWTTDTERDLTSWNKENWNLCNLVVNMESKFEIKLFIRVTFAGGCFIWRGIWHYEIKKIDIQLIICDKFTCDRPTWRGIMKERNLWRNVNQV